MWVVVDLQPESVISLSVNWTASESGFGSDTSPILSTLPRCTTVNSQQSLPHSTRTNMLDCSKTTEGLAFMVQVVSCPAVHPPKLYINDHLHKDSVDTDAG